MKIKSVDKKQQQQQTIVLKLTPLKMHLIRSSLWFVQRKASSMLSIKSKHYESSRENNKTRTMSRMKSKRCDNHEHTQILEELFDP